jgi:predicted DNA-binding protein
MIQSTQYSTPTNKRTMSLKQLNVKIPEQELRILEAFAEKTERTKTDIIREFIRSLQAKIWRLAKDAVSPGRETLVKRTVGIETLTYASASVTLLASYRQWDRSQLYFW